MRLKAAKLFLPIVILLLLFTGNAHAKTNSQILIINQVRGNECCSKGIINNFKGQVEYLTKSDLPASFVLRYDALTDRAYIDYLKTVNQPNINFGLLLEITPSLAKDAGVKFNNSAKDSIEAQDIYSIGYSENDNEKMADVLFERFFDIFGYYPKITTSWFIDTNLLNYLNQRYGVQINEITREQVDVDGYTLYGGPPHYPYPAGQNWAFIPDYNRPNPPLIIRQTLTDPLYNYGDSTGTFTSQPNDYLQNKKFDYFKKLLDQAMFGQEQDGFATIGLENSEGDKYQKEFNKQIDLLKSYKNENKIAVASLGDIYSSWVDQKITVYTGQDLVNNTNNRVYWITTPNYRIRLRQEGEKVFIDDIRVYNPAFTDPYSIKPAHKKGYWIVPFALEGFQMPHAGLQDQTQSINKFLTLRSDIKSESNRINLPKAIDSKTLRVSQSESGVMIDYKSSAGQKITLNFNETDIDTTGISSSQFVYHDIKLPYYPVNYLKTNNGFELFWDKLLSMKTSCVKVDCNISFDSDSSYLPKERKTNYEYLVPEQYGHPVDGSNSIFYTANKYAIINKSNVRSILIPYDKYGLVTSAPKPKIYADQPITSNIITQGQRYFLDFDSTIPTQTNVKVDLGNGVVKNQTIYFAPNCKENIKQCFKNPKLALWYLKSILGSRGK